MNKYVRILRLDHWIKQLFILPGTIAAVILADVSIDLWFIRDLVLAFLATCFIASSNYTINEWLDAQFDQFHPTKKHRSVVENDLNPRIVYGMYFATAVIGIGLSVLANPWVLGMNAWLWVMGILYNVRPMRTKDIPFVDVLSESLNNAIRLLIGWFAAVSVLFPPISLVLGYWLGGSFLMAVKRFAEYRMIGDPEIAAKYRKSFVLYTQRSLCISAFFYAMCSVFFLGIFLIKYRYELIVLVPFLIGLFAYYFWLSFNDDSAVQKPEKLFHERGLMAYTLFLAALFFVLMIVDIPSLAGLASSDLIPIR